MTKHTRDEEVVAGYKSKRKSDTSAGTATAEGRSATVTFKELDPEMEKLVEVYNKSLREQYDALEAAGILTAPMPVARVQLIHISQVQANDYNPNSVAATEMKLLHTSISEDGYTMPIVAMWDDEIQKAVIVDGFHRYTTMRRYQDIADRSSGYIPVSLIEKDIADRIASTVRHNRARGKHSVAGQGKLVFDMLAAGETDATICNKLGLEAEELARLKHITGFSKLFQDTKHTKVVTTKTQAEARAAFSREHAGEPMPEGV